MSAFDDFVRKYRKKTEAELSPIKDAKVTPVKKTQLKNGGQLTRALVSSKDMGGEAYDLLKESEELYNEFLNRSADPLGNVDFNHGAARCACLVTVAAVNGYKVYKQNTGVDGAQEFLRAILHSIQTTIANVENDKITFTIEVEEGRAPNGADPLD